MPFQNHGNRAFNAMSIRKNAPASSGVYGLADSQGWILVGDTADIRTELMQYLRNPSTLLQQYPPSGFTFEESGPESRQTRRNQLVQELSPLGNR